MGLEPILPYIKSVVLIQLSYEGKIIPVHFLFLKVITGFRFTLVVVIGILCY